MSVLENRSAVFTDLKQKADGAERSVRVLAQVLADEMETIHREPMSINIDHQRGFVLIRVA